MQNYPFQSNPQSDKTVSIPKPYKNTVSPPFWDYSHAWQKGTKIISSGYLSDYVSFVWIKW